MLRLYNDDCLKVMKDISSNSIDLILCDLPFGCLAATGMTEEEKESGKYGNRVLCWREGGEWDIKINLEEFWKEVKRIRRNEHTPTLHFCTTRYGYELIQSNPKEFRYDLVWFKERGVSFLSVNKMPMRSHEMVYVFSKMGAYYNRVDISGNFQKWEVKKEGFRRSQTYHSVDGSPKDENGYYKIPLKPHSGGDGKRSALSVITVKTNPAKGKHPTEKPVDLYKFLIERYCPEGGTVLDPTFGSGNSGLAAKELNRKYIGIERSKEFFEKAKKKLLPE